MKPELKQKIKTIQDVVTKKHREGQLLKDGGPLAVIISRIVEDFNNKLSKIEFKKGDKGDQGPPGKDAEPAADGEAGPMGPKPVLGKDYNIPTAEEVAKVLIGDKDFILAVSPRAGRDYELPKNGLPGVAPALIDLVNALKNDREFLQIIKGERGDPGLPADDAEPLTAEIVAELINNGSVQIDASKIKNIPEVRRALPQITLLGRSGGRALLISDGNQLFQDIQVLEISGAGGSVVREGTRAIINLSGGISGLNVEIPTGVVDGVNRVFTVTHTPVKAVAIDGNLHYGNGASSDGSDDGYNFSGTTITCNADLPPVNTIRSYY